MTELNRCGKIYENVISYFRNFCLYVCAEEKKNCINNLIEMNKDDTDVNTFKDELGQLLNSLDEENKQSTNSMYKKALAMKEIVEIILKILLTMPVSNASREHSFSWIKRVKKYHRNSMSEERLNNMAFLHRQSDLFKSINLWTDN